jgi:uncharacterized Zn finger protein
MAVGACLACGCRDYVPLVFASEDAVVQYYRCASCGHVWFVPKEFPEALPSPVTVLPRARTS